MHNPVVVIVLWLAIGGWVCFWLIVFMRLLIVSWVDKWEKKVRHVEAVRALLDDQYSKDTIDWVIHGDRIRRHPMWDSLAAMIAKRVHKWKEWADRDVDYDLP